MLSEVSPMFLVIAVRYECPGTDVMNSFGQGIHKYIGLEVRV